MGWNILKNTISLNNVDLNKTVIVKDILCDKHSKRRFLDLGIIKGTLITPLFRSPFSDPTAYEINNTVIAIRKEDASLIKVLNKL